MVVAAALVALEPPGLEGVGVVERLDLVDNGGVVAVMLVGVVLIRDPGKEVVGGTGAGVGGKYLRIHVSRENGHGELYEPYPGTPLGSGIV